MVIPLGNLVSVVEGKCDGPKKTFASEIGLLLLFTINQSPLKDSVLCVVAEFNKIIICVNITQ